LWHEQNFYITKIILEDSPELARRGAKKRPLNSDSSNIEINSKPIDFPPQKSEVKISESKVRFEVNLIL
jgi:hypothetical protein